MTTTRSFLPNNCPLINALTCCANCNKEAEPFKLQMCTACCSVCYCDVACQKAHRKRHKHQCNKDVQLLQEAATDFATTLRDMKENNTDGDDELFQPIPPKDDCPICTLPLPIDDGKTDYHSCCGNLICDGCGQEDTRVTLENGKIPCCAFCRAPLPLPSSDEESIIRLKKRMEMNDSAAILLASDHHKLGLYGLPKDPQMAFEMCLRAAELGNSEACYRVAGYYYEGEVVAKDMVKEREYLIKAVKKDDVKARQHLGVVEWNKCNYQLASRHFLIAAAAGCTLSLEEIAKLYRFKLITKKEYSIALASYGNVHKDEWSIERERAAAMSL